MIIFSSSLNIMEANSLSLLDAALITGLPEKSAQGNQHKFPQESRDAKKQFSSD